MTNTARVRPDIITGNTFANLVLMICLSLVVTACSMGGKRDGAPDSIRDISNIPDATPRAEARSRQGNPVSYAVFGKRYKVMESAEGYVRQGTASWYGTKFHGRRTSNGEIYDMYKMTAAHKTLPLPSYVRVTNLDNNRKIIVRVNDRGPFHEDRIIDLSYVAARKLGITANGTGHVEVQIIETAGLQNLANVTLTTTPSSAPTVKESDIATLPKNYFLQVGAFRKFTNAKQLSAQLSGTISRPVRISEFTVQADLNAEEDLAEDSESSSVQGTLYRVRIGPFPDFEQTENAARELSALGYVDSQIVTE